MTFAEWRKKHRLTQSEAAEIAGVSANAVYMAERDGRAVKCDGNRVATILEGELPSFEFSADAGSYNQPVVMIGGVAHGPADVVRGDGRIAAHIVLLWACSFERADEDYQTARRFLRYWPEGPQLK